MTWPARPSETPRAPAIGVSMATGMNSPQDLVRHDCINHRQGRSGGLNAWEFEKDGREVRVRVEGQITYNTTFPMLDAAITGRGVAFVPEDLVADALAAGKLVQVLDDWCPRFSGFHLYYPSRRQLSPAMLVIIEMLHFRMGAR